MLLAFGVTLAVSASASATETTPQITVTKSVTDNFVLPGGTIHYKYVVTANDRFTGSTVVVTDNKCSPVQPTLGGGPGGAYNIGDTADFGFLNGFLGEAWQFTCTATAPAANPGADLTNTATVVGNIAYDGFTQFSDTDTFTLESWVLRKHVVLYWDFVHEIVAPGTGDVTFPVDIYKNSVKVGTGNVSANTPLSLWLTPGSWRLTEGTPPTGYTVLRGDWVIGGVPNASSEYPDNTFFDQAQFDLAIAKSGPLLAHAGDNITYTYDVTTTGPGLVTPTVTDDTCSPVALATPSGDDGDTLIQPSETWHFTCTTSTAPDWATAFPSGNLTNTATVADANRPSGAPWNLGLLMGGDTTSANNTDTYTLYPFALRKDVGLPNDSGYPDFPGFADNKPFTVNAYLNDVLVNSPLTISESSPQYLWLAPGTWKFVEFNVPAGYAPFYPDGTITATVPDGYPDFSELNLAPWSGCSLGFWKTHTSVWPSPWTSTTQLKPTFAFFTNATFLTGLNYGGGPGITGGQQILLKQAVAALLNETKYGTAFGPYTSQAALITAVNAALNSGNRTTMTDLASALDSVNNGVCRP